MDTDAASLLAFVIPGLAIPAVLLVASIWSPTQRQVARWGAACDVVITPANEPMIRAHLGRSRRFRSAASFPFWWMAAARVVDADFPPALATPAIGMAAYLLGALVAELTSPLGDACGVRRASLLPRRIEDYRPKWVQHLTAGLFAVAAAATAVGLVLVDDPSGGGRSLWLKLALCVVVVGVAEVAARAIVRRPQRGDDPDLLAADDGLRAAAVSLTSGAALLAGIAAASVAAGSAVPAETGAWALVLVLALFVLQGIGLGVLTLIVRQETWGYRRRYAQRPRTVPA